MAKPKDVVSQIKKETRRKFSADEGIRIVLEGLRGESTLSELCSGEGIAASVYYKWSKAVGCKYSSALKIVICLWLISKNAAAKI